MTTNDGCYEALRPRGERQQRTQPLAKRLDTLIILNGPIIKTLGFNCTRDALRNWNIRGVWVLKDDVPTAAFRKEERLKPPMRKRRPADRICGIKQDCPDRIKSAVLANGHIKSRSRFDRPA